MVLTVRHYGIGISWPQQLPACSLEQKSSEKKTIELNYEAEA